MAAVGEASLSSAGRLRQQCVWFDKQKMRCYSFAANRSVVSAGFFWVDMHFKRVMIETFASKALAKFRRPPVNVRWHATAAPRISYRGFRIEELENRRLLSISVVPNPTWAGYAVSTNADYVTDVRGDWTVPYARASRTGSATVSSAVWVGIDGWFNGTVEQIGTAQDITSNGASYYCWFEMAPAGPTTISLFTANGFSTAVSPGDQISASVQYVGPGNGPFANSFYFDIVDVTTGGFFEKYAQNSAALRSTAEWVVEDPTSTINNTVEPLTNFGNVTFTNAITTINGVTSAIDQVGGQVTTVINGVTTTIPAGDISQAYITGSSSSPGSATTGALSDSPDSDNIGFTGLASSFQVQYSSTIPVTPVDLGSTITGGDPDPSSVLTSVQPISGGSTYILHSDGMVVEEIPFSWGSGFKIVDSNDVTAIAANSDGSIYCLDSGSGTDPTSWINRITSEGATATIDSNNPIALVAAGDGSVYTIDTGVGLPNSLVQWTSDAEETTVDPNDVTSVVTAGDGTVWGLEGAGSLFRWSGTPPSSTSIATAVQSIAAGSNSTVNVALADGEVRQYNGLAYTTLQAAAAAIYLGASSNATVLGEAVILTAQASGASLIPTGTVTFIDNGTTIGTAPLDSEGSASLQTSQLPAGSNTITANYSGDSNYPGNSSSPVVVTVGLLPSVANLSGLSEAISVGQSDTFTVAVAAASGSGPMPTGNVKFLDNGTAVGASALNGDGDASWQTSQLTAGSNTITADYSGDSSYAADSSSPVVVAVGLLQSVTDLAGSAETMVVGQADTFTVVVAAASGNGPVPTGNVTIFLDGIAQGTYPVRANGELTAKCAGLSSASQASFTASYGGDANYAASASPTFTVTYLPESAAVPSIGGAVIPANGIAGQRFNARIPIKIENTVGVLRGKFTVHLYLDKAGEGLDGEQTQLVSVTKKLALYPNKSVVVPFAVRSLPASLGAGSYHFVAEITDPLGDSCIVTLPQMATISLPSIALATATGHITPATIEPGRSGILVISVTDTGNVVASGILDITVLADDPSGSATDVTLSEFERRVAIAPDQTGRYRLKIAIPKTTAPGSVNPVIEITLDGVTATVNAGASLNIGET